MKRGGRGGWEIRTLCKVQKEEGGGGEVAGSKVENEDKSNLVLTN